MNKFEEIEDILLLIQGRKFSQEQADYLTQSILARVASDSSA